MSFMFIISVIIRQARQAFLLVSSCLFIDLAEVHTTIAVDLKATSRRRLLQATTHCSRLRLATNFSRHQPLKRSNVDGKIFLQKAFDLIYPTAI